jgi:hypothetical protein
LVALVAAALALGLLAFGSMLATGSSEAQSGSMHNCPPAGKWSIAVWEGDSGAAADAALATCGANSVAAAYSLDPQTGGWSRWFAGKPDVSNLPPLSDLQGVLALGAGGGPVVTATPAGTPTPGTGDVTLVGTNSWTSTSPFLIDGEERRVTVVGELRNDSPTDRSVGKITIRFYDGAGQQVGIRETSPFDHILRPGRTTAFNEELPSITYYENETNNYPEGWTKYEITFSSDDASEYTDTLVDMTFENVQISDGGHHVTGNVVNASSKTARSFSVDAYVIYRREDGTILNAAVDYLLNDPLPPGESLPFDITVSGEVDFSSYVVQGHGDTE